MGRYYISVGLVFLSKVVIMYFKYTGELFLFRPDGKKFRTRQDIQNYLDVHPGIVASMDMFDFSVYRGRRGGKIKQKMTTETPPPPPPASVSETEEQTESVVEETPTKPGSLFCA